MRFLKKCNETRINEKIKSLDYKKGGAYHIGTYN